MKISEKQAAFKEVLSFLKENDHFLITTHVNADGDAYGAALAIAYYLDGLEKQYQVVLHDAHPDEKYRFLWGWDSVLGNSAAPQKPYQAAIAVDVSSRQRLGDVSALLPLREKCLKIDHHPFEDDFASVNIVDTGASSTCQLIFELLEFANVVPDEELATLLYTGLIYDNGRFSNTNTTTEDFRIARLLVSYGVQPNRVANQVFSNHNVLSINTIGYALSNLQLYLDNKVCLIYLPLEYMNAGPELDVDPLADYSIAIRGVEAGLFVREVSPDFYKVSLRSRGTVNVGRVATAFGGGGHDHAAGCRFSGQLDKHINAIVSAIDGQLSEKGRKKS